MDFDDRLKNHLNEQAAAIEIETGDPAAVSATNRRSNTAISTLTALVVMVAAGAGFLALSGGDAGPTTEIAASEASEVETSGSLTATIDAFQTLEVIDVSSPNSPGFGQARVDGGVYYILSTAPGPVSLDQSATEEDYMQMYRPNTFYVFDEESGWSASQLEDRFISDFSVDEGVIYVVSTGSKTSDVAALGSSPDRGQTWTWSDLTELPEVDQVNMLLDGDQTILFASRYGFPGYEEAKKAAIDAGLYITDFNLYDFNSVGITYLDIDPADRCAAVEAQYLPEIAGFREMLDSEEFVEEFPNDEERFGVESEFWSMIGYMKERFAASDCEWNTDWETGDIDDLSFAAPEPTFATWEELGFTPPESWRSFASTYSYDGEILTDLGKPFNDDFQVGWTVVENGTLQISGWNVTDVEAEAQGETVWTTTNGVNWKEEVRRYDEEGESYYNSNYSEPRAGEYVFRTWWEEEAYEEFHADQTQPATTIGPDLASEALDDAYLGATTTIPSGEPERNNTTTTTVLDETERSPDTSEDSYEVEEDIYEVTESPADTTFYGEPEPKLQRRVGTSEWETVTLAELTSDVNIGDRVLRDVRGTQFGVFLVYGEPYSLDGPPEPGVTVVYSNNGLEWGTFDLNGNGVDTYGPSASDDELLLFSTSWGWDEVEGEQTETQTVLIRPAG